MTAQGIDPVDQRGINALHADAVAHRPPPGYHEDAIDGGLRKDSEVDPEADDLLEFPGKSWTEVDLTAVVAGLLSGKRNRPTPTIGARSDGWCIVYPGKVNGIHSPSGAGKTMCAIHIAAQELDAGNHVVMTDYEGSEDEVVARFLDQGVTPHVILARFHYIAPQEPFDDASRVQFAPLLERYKPSLVILDSVGESLSMDGLNSNSDLDVTGWGRKLPRWIAAQGPAVVLVDHQVKNRETRGLDAAGSFRKLAAITGAAYVLETITEAGKGRHGKAKLVTAKDRHGTYARGSTAAVFHLDSVGDRVDAWLDAPEASTESNGFSRPTVLMAKVSKYITENPGLTKNGVVTGVGGKAEYTKLAIELLIAEGYINVKSGPNRAQLHTSVRPFDE